MVVHDRDVVSVTILPAASLSLKPWIIENGNAERY